MPKFIRPTPAVWTVLLLAAGFGSNTFLTCGSNLVAFAVIAAVTLRFRVAAFIALVIWFESQILGFTILGYPHEPMTVAWGAALGAATLVAAGVAASCAGRARPGAFFAAFATYELALAAFDLATRSGPAGFTPAIVLALFWSNALIALGALIAYPAAGWLEATLKRSAIVRRHA